MAPAPAEPDPVTHPDFGLLAAPADESLAADLALLSWVASGQADPLPEAAPPGATSNEAAANSSGKPGEPGSTPSEEAADAR